MSTVVNTPMPECLVGATRTPAGADNDTSTVATLFAVRRRQLSAANVRDLTGRSNIEFIGCPVCSRLR